MFMWIFLLSVLNATLFVIMPHPVSSALLIMVQTVLACITSGLVVKSFWFSYMLFLIFLGGMLVLIMYVTSLSSNELFSFPSTLGMMMLLITMTINLMLVFMNYDSFPADMLSTNCDMLDYVHIALNMPDRTLPNQPLYNDPMTMITVMLISHLLIGLIVIVTIVKVKDGPLKKN